MKLHKNKYDEIVFKDEFSNENSIHIIHCGETIEEIKEDVAMPYIVLEESTNYARVHLVTDFSEGEALHQIDQYLREEEGADDTHLLAVFKCSLT